MEYVLTIYGIYDILIVEKVGTTNPNEKGKPFERVGHKALEPKSPKDLWLSAASRI